MTNVLVTGGAGKLGHHVVEQLLEKGYTIRIMSRHAAPSDLSSGAEWVQANLESGEGLADTVRNIDVIVHAASDPAHSQQIDVEGTRLLVARAREANVSHIVYISIVGIDRIPFKYYEHKLAAEEIIKASGIPWSILRATQFHFFAETFIQPLMKTPLVAFVPTDLKCQPCAVQEAAARLCEIVAAGPSGMLPDFGGPEVLTFAEMAQQWLQVRGMHRTIVPLYIPGKMTNALRRGYGTCPDEPIHGKITWQEWLQEKYAMKVRG